MHEIHQVGTTCQVSVLSSIQGFTSYTYKAITNIFQRVESDSNAMEKLLSAGKMNLSYLHTLGTGCNGSVMAAKFMDNERSAIAVKKIEKKYWSSKEELEYLIRLRYNPYVVHLVKYFETEQEYILALEYSHQLMDLFYLQ